MSKPVLFMMHGAYGSGKSTFARQLAGELPATWLRSDKVRAELREQRQADLSEEDEALVFGSMNAAALEALSQGESVIYDGFHSRPGFRQDIRAATADKLQVPAIVIWMQAPIAECIKRATNRHHDEHAVIIPEAKVRADAEQLINPAPHEQYIAIDGMVAFAAQYQQFMAQLEEIPY
jgi:predicted kinase